MSDNNTPDIQNDKSKQSFLKRFWWIGIILGACLVVVILMAIKNIQRDRESSQSFIPETQNNNEPTIGTTNKNQTSESQQPKDMLSSLPACQNTKELFTTFPVEDGKFSSITPLGNLNPSSHTFPTDHIYVEVADPQHPERNTLDKAKSLIAPADMWILAIKMSEQVGGVTDWAMDFSPCKDVKGQFGHVGSISDKIKNEIDKVDGKCNEYETGGHKFKSCSYNNLKVKVAAGEKIGTAGSERSGMLDIWMSDYREPQVKRANASRWSPDRNYVSCFLDYLPTSQKNQYYNLLRGPNQGIRTKEPRCGTTEVDIAGTTQGVWFYKPESLINQEDPHLALIFDNMETDKQVFSVGTSAGSAGLSSTVYRFTPKTSGNINRDFSQVTANGSVYCYDTINNNVENKSILLTMPTPEKLRIQKYPTTCGTGPWTMSDGFIEYER